MVFEYVLAILVIAGIGIFGPLFLLKTRKRQGPPQGPRHTDTTPGPSGRQQGH